MSEKRRDSKGRILRVGESQRKDGRYAYKYRDAFGVTKFIYSWRLTPSDPTPSGKQAELSLREKEKQAQRDQLDGISANGGTITVLQLVKKYVGLQKGARHNTKAGYETVINLLEKESFGRQRINKVKLSDAKVWFVKLQSEGKGYSSIHAIHGVVRPAFAMAVDDDLIRKNPFSFKLASVVVNDTEGRVAVSEKWEREFLDFVKSDPTYSKYYDGIYILFKTGLRISEFAGLTTHDLDMKKRKIYVDHQLQRTRAMEYYIEDTKTVSGIREIPMSDGVYECFNRILQNRPRKKNEMMIDGRIGFLYFDKNDRPMVAIHWDKCFQRICQKYNKNHEVHMPTITPHVCRHTFCTNMAKNGMNPKFLQYLMGHSNISITLNVYAHVNFEDAETELLRIANDS